MKKRVIAAISLVAVMAMSLVGCGSGSNGENQTKGGEIALVTATGSIDDKSFNQGAWEGLKEYADKNSITYKYYKPVDQSATALEEAIKLSILGGAKIVVCPGYLFETPLFNLQDQYPDVTFMLLDGAPTSAEGTQTIGQNVASYVYAEEEAGFLAGYAAVMDGYRNLGFMGGIAVPAVVRYGYGFVQGAEYAAKELGLDNGAIGMKYTYVGNFDATPDNMVKASTWYNSGTEVIFACGGSVGNSVMSAASSVGKNVIGVDIDQASESETVITSAMKNISKTVYDAVEQYYNGSLVKGTLTTLNATTDSVLLPMATSKFKTFNEEQYNKIYSELESGNVTILKDKDAETVKDLPLEKVTVVVTE